MKYPGHLVLLLIPIVWIGCNSPVAKKPPVNDSARHAVLEKKFQKLLNEGKYDSMITEAKKTQAKAASENDKNTVAYMYNVLGFAFKTDRQIDSAIYYFKKGEAFDITIKNNAYMVKAQSRIAELFYDLGKPDSVNVYKDKISREADTMKDIPHKMQLTEKLADIYGTTNQPERALKLYFPLLEYAKSKKDSLLTGAELVNIAEMYAKISDFNKAIDYVLQALNYLNDDTFTKAISYNDLGSYYIDTKQYEKAITAFKKCINVANSSKNIAYIEDTYVAIASPLIELKRYKEATGYLDKAQAYFKRNKYETGLMYATIMLGKMARNQGNYAQAIDYFEKALEIAKKTGHVDSESYVYGLLADVCGKAGLFEKAYRYDGKYNTVRDSIEKTTSKKSIADLEIKYQTNQKEQKIALLNQESKLKDIELTDERRKWWFLLGFVAFLLVTAFLLYRSYAQKKTSNKQLEEKNLALNLLNEKLDEANSSKTKLFSILSHDLRAPVSNLFSFLNIQKNHSDKLSPQQQAEHNDRIRHSAENLMESMEDLLIWSKSQMNSFSLNPVPVNTAEVVEYVMTLHRDFAAERKLILEGGNEDGIVLFTDVNFLKIVLRNIVSNAIKFTPAGGSIKIFAQKVDNSVQFTVADTGPGITKEQIANLFEWNSIRSDSSGLGLKLAKEFITRVGGTIQVKSETGVGTTFVIVVPSTQEITESLTGD